MRVVCTQQLVWTLLRESYLLTHRSVLHVVLNDSKLPVGCIDFCVIDKFSRQSITESPNEYNPPPPPKHTRSLF